MVEHHDIVILKRNLAERLNAEIRASGMTQIEVAKKIGVSQPRISNLKNMELDKFSVDILLSFLGHLGFNMFYGDAPNILNIRLYRK